MTSHGQVSRIIEAGRRQLAPSAENGRATLWPLPVTAVVVSVAVGAALVRWRPGDTGTPGRWLWPGGRETAMSMLQLVPTAVMTATSVTFSLMVVALQMSSQQFSPRLLRQLTRDRLFKGVLAVLVATFALPVTVLRSLSDDADVPRMAMAMTFLLALASLIALITFIAHMARTLRVDTMMRTVHAETRHAIVEFYPPGSADAQLDDCELPRGDPLVTEVGRSGFVQVVDAPQLTQEASRAGLVIKLEVRPGDHVVTGNPLAVVWGADPDDLDDLSEVIHAAVEIRYERTLEQDPSFGFRELTDIAVKALSPALNDPVTADHAVGHMSDLLVDLTGRRLGPMEHRDDDGDLRLITLDRDFRYYLDLPCGQIRRFGSREPTVLLSLLRMLRDVAVRCTDEGRRSEVRRQVELILRAPADPLDDVDRGALEDMAARIERAFAGDLIGAYRDRAGVTTSM